MKNWILLLASLVALGANASNANISNDSLNIAQITQFDGTPWGIAVLNDQEAIITIKQGDAYRVNLVTGEKQALTGLPTVDKRRPRRFTGCG